MKMRLLHRFEIWQITAMKDGCVYRTRFTGDYVWLSSDQKESWQLKNPNRVLSNVSLKENETFDSWYDANTKTEWVP